MYEILIERTAERDLRALPTTLFNRIVPRSSQIEPDVEQVMKVKFKDGDREVVSRGRERWQLMIRRSHRHLLREGWLENRPGKVWKITAAGRQAAKADVASGTQKQTIS